MLDNCVLDTLIVVIFPRRIQIFRFGALDLPQCLPPCHYLPSIPNAGEQKSADQPGIGNVRRTLVPRRTRAPA